MRVESWAAPPPRPFPPRGGSRTTVKMSRFRRRWDEPHRAVPADLWRQDPGKGRRTLRGAEGQSPVSTERADPLRYDRKNREAASDARLSKGGGKTQDSEIAVDRNPIGDASRFVDTTPGLNNHWSSSADTWLSGSRGVDCGCSGRGSSSPNKPETSSRSPPSDFRHAAGTSKAPAARSSSMLIKRGPSALRLAMTSRTESK